MGGSSSRQVQETQQKTEIPSWYEDAVKLQIKRADELQKLGRMPYMGPEVAAINPAEIAASRNVGQMASAFGLEAPAELSMGDMPTVTQGGLTGYTSYPAYIANMERLKEQRPDQYDFFSRMTGFDPITGAEVEQMSTLPAQTSTRAAPAPAAAPVDRMAYAPPEAAYFKNGQYFRADGSGIGAGTGQEKLSHSPTSAQKYGYVNSGGFIDAPSPSGSLFSGMRNFFGG
jgi:hypothetical protein